VRYAIVPKNFVILAKFYCHAAGINFIVMPQASMQLLASAVSTTA